MSTCKSCGARIIWCKHITTGKSMPVDAVPSWDGNIIVSECPESGTSMARVIAGRLEGEMFADEPKHLSHFATCPNAKQHRKG